jgi:hypothetical protein
VAFELTEGDLLVVQTDGPSISMPSHCGLFSCLVFIGYSNSRFCLTM